MVRVMKSRVSGQCVYTISGVRTVYYYYTTIRHNICLKHSSIAVSGLF